MEILRFKAKLDEAFKRVGILNIFIHYLPGFPIRDITRH